jgi:hypothetical protein
MSFNISNVLTFETVCAEGSSARHLCVQLEGFFIDSGHQECRCFHIAN